MDFPFKVIPIRPVQDRLLCRASQVLVHISSHMPQSKVEPAGPTFRWPFTSSPLTDALVLASVFVNTLADHDYLFRVGPTLRLYQLQAGPAHRGGSPYGLQDSLCTLVRAGTPVRAFRYLVRISGASHGGLSVEPTPNVL